MGIRNRDGALYSATGIDNSGLYAGRREAIGIIKAMAGEITSFDVFSGIGISAATAFAKAAKSSYDFEKEFRKNMLEVATISTLVTNDMTGFMNQVMDITQEIPITAPEAAKALYQIVSAGHDGAAGMHILEISAKSAIGGMTDTATAADAITTLINAYKLSAEDADMVSDQLFTTARLGKTTFGELGQSIAQVAPIAAAYGVEMDQVLAAVATLTKSGTPTAQAMTQIRASIIAASKELGDGAFEGRTFQEALELIAKKANGSEAAIRDMITEVEAQVGILALTGEKAKDAAADLDAMNKSAGATEAAFKKMMEDVDKQMILLSNNIQEALRPMGEAILKEVSEVATAFNDALKNGEAKEAMKSLGGLIVIVMGAFIGYKGSVIATTAAQNAYTKALAISRLASIQQITTTQLLTNSIKAQTAAMLKNIAALATNPYVLAAAAIAALGYGIYRYATQATAAEKAMAAHNKRVNDLKALAEDTTKSTEGLLTSLRDENILMTERVGVYEKLKGLYPGVLDNISLENFLLMDSVEANNLLAKSLDERIKAQQKADVNTIEAEMKSNNAKILGLESKKSKNGDSGDKSIFGELTLGESFELDKLKKRNEQLQIEFDKARAIVVQGLKDETAAKKVTASLDLDNESGKTVLERKIKLTKELAEEEAKLNKLRAPSSTAKNSEIKASEDKVKEIKGKVEALTGLSANEGDKLKGLQSDLSRSILDSELKLQSGRIAIMEDGKAKRIALAKQETRDTIAAIQKEKEEYRQKAKESKEKVDPTVIKTFDNRELAAKAKEKADIARMEKEYADEYKQRTKVLADVFLNEEQRKLSAIKTRYSEERKWADEQLRTGGMTKEEHTSYSVNINNAEQQETYRSLLDNLNDYKQQEKDLRDKWDTDINAAVEAKDAYLVAKLQEGKQKALSSLNGQMLQETNEWQQLFGDLDNLTVTQIDNLISIIEDKAKDLKLNPVDLREVTNSLNQAKQKVIELNPFKSLGDSIKTVFSSGSKDSKRSTEDIKKDWNNLAKSTEGCFEFVNDAVASCGVLGDILGESGQQIIGMIQGVATAGIAMAAAIKTAETASVVLAAISLALQAVTALFSLFNGDKKHEKNIERLQDQIDVLDKSYEKLGRSIEKAYSKDASGLIDQQNKMLERQKVLIQQQIREEEAKKKTDNDKIKDWENQIEDINDTIAENKEKAVDAIFGEDLKSAIENFADAYANAWASGEDRAKSAKDTVRNMMRQMVTESIKAAMESSKAMEQIRTKLEEFYADNVLSGWEQDYIYKMAEGLQSEMDEKFGWADSLMRDNEPKDGVSGQLQAAMTEGTASQLVGLWNSTSIDMRELKQISLSNGETVSSILTDVSEIMRQNILIEQNTRRGADNTDGLIGELQSGFNALDRRLGEIERNTKVSKSRG